MSCKERDDYFEGEVGSEQAGKRRKIEDTSSFGCRDVDHGDSELMEDSCGVRDQESMCVSDLKGDGELVKPDADSSHSDGIVKSVSQVMGNGGQVDCDDVSREMNSSCADHSSPTNNVANQITELKKQETVMKDGNDAGGNFVATDAEDKEEKHKVSMEIDDKRKLLVLDVNGLLADVVSISFVSDDYKADIVIGMKAVFKRPHCDDFLHFCFERFRVGIWSSRTKRNLDSILELLLGEHRSKLAFCWDQSHCTLTGFNTIDNQKKPLVLKELKKLWQKDDPSLPWNIGDYDESNTLLLDDSPYKGLKNPPNTAIFPDPYQYKNLKDDSLGPKGDLRDYLEELSLAPNVQKYVEHNLYGQLPITKSNPSWHFYAKVIGMDFAKQEEPSIHKNKQHSDGDKLTLDRNPHIQPKERNSQSTTNDSVHLSSKTNQQGDCSAGTATKACSPLIQRSFFGRNREVFRKRKLLILDVNGLLADFVSYKPHGFTPHSMLGDKAVFKRPYCDDFLNFCFERFRIGFWMTTSRKNAQSNLDLFLGRDAKNVLFSWNLSHCLETDLCTLEGTQGRNRPIFFKELRKVWEKDEPNLPWRKYEFDSSNTLLVDNFPHSALLNPPHTAIFPPRYRFTDESTDSTLGPKNDLRVFLEEIAGAENVQEFVKNKPYGQSPISDKHPSWNHYVQFIEDTKARQKPWSEWWTLTNEQRNEQSFTPSLDKLGVDQNVVLTECSSIKPFENRSIHEDETAISDTGGPNPTTQTDKQKTQSEMKDPVHLSFNKDQKQDCKTGCVTVVTSREPPAPWIPHSSLRSNPEVFRKTKLLILDVNGLLADFVSYYDPDNFKADSFLGDKAVFKRPYCDDFLNFCFDKFHIGFWLTTNRSNAQCNVNFFLGRATKDLIFSWDKSHCFETSFQSLERRDRHIILKELRRVWENEERYPSRGRVKFDQSNTLLVDNYPSTALLNPPHTAIFPRRYWYKNEKTDDSLGPGGDLREFLEGLALANNVQDYVKHNPFGQTPISDKIPNWKYYSGVIDDTEARKKAWAEQWWTPRP